MRILYLLFLCLKHIKNGWRAKFLKMLKSNFELVGRKYVRCIIAVQNFKKELTQFMPLKTSYERIFF